MAKRTLAQKKMMPNSGYWLAKADEAFMVQFRGLPCEFCEKLGIEHTEGTCFHHVIAKKQSKSLRYDKRNGIVLCPAHHKWSNDMAAHSDSVFVVQAWVDFFKKHFEDRYNWCMSNGRLKYRFTYREAYEAIEAGLTEYARRQHD